MLMLLSIALNLALSLDNSCFVPGNYLRLDPRNASNALTLLDIDRRRLPSKLCPVIEGIEGTPVCRRLVSGPSGATPALYDLNNQCPYIAPVNFGRSKSACVAYYELSPSSEDTWEWSCGRGERPACRYCNVSDRIESLGRRTVVQPIRGTRDLLIKRARRFSSDYRCPSSIKSDKDPGVRFKLILGGCLPKETLRVNDRPVASWLNQFRCASNYSKLVVRQLAGCFQAHLPNTRENCPNNSDYQAVCLYAVPKPYSYNF